MMDATPAYAIVGRIRKPQGICGEVTVELLTDTPDAHFAAGHRVFAGTVDGDLATDPNGPPGPSTLLVEEARPFKGGLIVKFDRIPDRTSAERWRQRYLLVPMAEVTPPGDDEVFVHELVGMRVVGEQGQAVGTVVETYELPQGLAIEVETPAGRVLVPYRQPSVREVDRAGRTLTVETDSGLFE